MVQTILIGLGAGAASGLLFASVVAGSAASVLLFYLAPLPIMIAALGWSHWAALLAAVAASGGLALAIGGYFFLPFILGVGLPAWWLGYLTLLARPTANTDGAAALDWYPVGRLVLWSGILGAFVVLGALPTLGLDETTFRSTLHQSFEAILRAENETPSSATDKATLDRVIDVLIAIIPPAAAVLSTTINLVDLWIAARIVRVSGRLRRPWPDLTETRLPRIAMPLLAAGVVACFLPGIAGIAGGIFLSAMLIAYAAAGLAALHALTRNTTSRTIVLGGAYVGLALFGWPLLLLSLLGLLDCAFDLRARRAKKLPPNSSAT